MSLFCADVLESWRNWARYRVCPAAFVEVNCSSSRTPTAFLSTFFTADCNVWSALSTAGSVLPPPWANASPAFAAHMDKQIALMTKEFATSRFTASLWIFGLETDRTKPELSLWTCVSRIVLLVRLRHNEFATT